MKKAMRGMVSVAVIFAMLLTMCSFTAMADSAAPTCYADVDEIVLTYSSAPDVTPILKKDGVTVETQTSVNENTIVIKPVSGEFARDVIYKLTAGDFTQYFRIKTLVNGIAETDVNTYDGSKGGEKSATVFIDSDNDGVKEMYHYNNNGIISFKDNEINTATNYTVKYTLSSYAIVTAENAEPSKNANSEYDYYNKVVSYLRWNAPSQSATAATAGIQLANANWQPIKYLSGTNWTDSGVTVADAGISKFAEANNKVKDPVNHGKILYDNGVSDIKVLSQPGVYADIKLKKLAKAGTIYIDGAEKYTTSSAEATTGYFFFGGGEGSMHNFIGIKNFVATTYQPLDIAEVKPVSYYGDKDKITVTFDHNVVSANNGKITVTQDGTPVSTNVSVKDNVVTVTPVSGEFSRDVESKIAISSGFGSESNFTSKEYSKTFIIKTVQDTISEKTFGTASSKKVYMNGNVYFYSDRLNPLSAPTALENYTVTMKVKPYLVESVSNPNLYMQISFNNSDAANDTNTGTIWNLQNYGDAIRHMNYNGSSYATDWSNKYGSFSDMGIPRASALKSIKTSNATPYMTFVEDAKVDVTPVTFKVTKKGNSGTLEVGSVTDTITSGSRTTGYFRVRSGASQSVIEVSEFIMTTFEEVVGDVSLSNVSATKANNSVTLTYDIKKNGNAASYPVWIVAAAYDSSKALLGAAASDNITLTADMTAQNITIQGIDTSKIADIRIFTWDNSATIKPYGETITDID